MPRGGPLRFVQKSELVEEGGVRRPRGLLLEGAVDGIELLEIEDALVHEHLRPGGIHQEGRLEMFLRVFRPPLHELRHAKVVQHRRLIGDHAHEPFEGRLGLAPVLSLQLAPARQEGPVRRWQQVETRLAWRFDLGLDLERDKAWGRWLDSPGLHHGHQGIEELEQKDQHGGPHLRRGHERREQQEPEDRRDAGIHAEHHRSGEDERPQDRQQDG